MFLDFFFALRAEKVPVSMQEWMSFLEALKKGLHGASFFRFYHLARACLVKSETHFDAFDRVFSRVFRGVEILAGDAGLHDELQKWLQEARQFPPLSEEQLAMLQSLTSQELMDALAKTLAEQKERHDGGGRWVGTGGHSPYGHSGVHPTGIRVGGAARGRSAMKVAEERAYLGYRTDVTLDVRQLRVALRRLRHLTRAGGASELDMEASIDATCQNAGEIELRYRAPKKNDVRVLLLMDVGGTMDPYAERVSQLLSAFVQSRGLRAFRSFYFHNCIYEHVFTHPWLRRQDAVPLTQLFRELDDRWRLMVVGDAAMHPAELLYSFGNIDHRKATETTGIACMQAVRDHFPASVWLNPDPQSHWTSYTTEILQSLFPMFHLSVEGLETAVAQLMKTGPGRKHVDVQ